MFFMTITIVYILFCVLCFKIARNILCFCIVCMLFLMSANFFFFAQVIGQPFSIWDYNCSSIIEYLGGFQVLFLEIILL